MKTIELTSKEIEQLNNGDNITWTCDHPMKYEQILIKKKPEQWEPNGGGQNND